jgi:hypothetical protein
MAPLNDIDSLPVSQLNKEETTNRESFYIWYGSVGFSLQRPCRFTLQILGETDTFPDTLLVKPFGTKQER